MKGLNLSKMLVMLLLTVSFNATFAQKETELSPDDKRELADSIKMLEDCKETVKEKDEELKVANLHVKELKGLVDTRAVLLEAKESELNLVKKDREKSDKKARKRLVWAIVGWSIVFGLALS